MEMRIEAFITMVAGMALLLTIGCTQAPPSAPDTRAADEAVVRRLETDWSNAASAMQLETVVSYYAGDAALMPPNQPIAVGPEAIHGAWQAIMEMPGIALHWEVTKADVAKSGELAYTYGKYELTFNDLKGKPLKDKGKFVDVWKKQADGNWKVVSDIFNSDTPAPVPANN